MGQKSGFLLDLLKRHCAPPGLSFPRRPSWTYNMTRESLMKKEEKSYRDYLDDLHSRNPPGTLSHFEHNLEVMFYLSVLNIDFRKYHIFYFIEVPLVLRSYEYVSVKNKNPLCQRSSRRSCSSDDHTSSCMYQKKSFMLLVVCFMSECAPL